MFIDTHTLYGIIIILAIALLANILYAISRKELIIGYEKKILDLAEDNKKNDGEYSRIHHKLAMMRDLYLWERYPDYRGMLIGFPLKVLIMLERYILELQRELSEARQSNTNEYRKSILSENEQYKQSFKLYHNAIRSLNNRWKEEHPDFEGHPDTATVAKWASEIIDGSKLTLNDPKLMYEYILAKSMFTEEQLLNLLGEKYQQRTSDALTPDEERELKELRELLKNSNVIMFGYQQDRLRQLQYKKYKYINPDPQSSADLNTHNHAVTIFQRFKERWNNLVSNNQVNIDREVIRQIEIGLMEYAITLKAKGVI
jgi:hypothetical protein